MTTRNRKTGDTHDIVLSPKMVGLGIVLFLTLLLGPEATKRVLEAYTGTSSPAVQTNESVKELRTEIGGIKADVAAVKADVMEVKNRVARVDDRVQGFIDGMKLSQAKPN